MSSPRREHRELGDNQTRNDTLAAVRTVHNRGRTVALASGSGADRSSTHRHGFGWTAVAVAVVGVAAGAVVLESTDPTLMPPEAALIIMAIAAGFFASVTTTATGPTIVINPAVCFSFAALLSYGLAPAIIAQLASVVVVHWRTDRSLRHSLEKAVQLCAAILAAAGVIDVLGFGARTGTAWWATPTGALAVVAAVATWLVIYVGVALLLEFINRGQSGFRALLRDHLTFLVLSKAALLALGPFLALAAEVNVALLPLALIPLAAVQQMARLSADRDRASRRDPLTSLANRTMLQESFGRMASAPKRRLGQDGRVAVLVVDLDGFKNVNDSLGHEVGDELLKVVADRLNVINTTTDGETVAGRLGGDEFAILTRVEDVERARRFAERVSTEVGKPVRLNELSVDVTASIGIALRESYDEDFSSVLRNADKSMYEAKRQSDAIAVYHPRQAAGQPDSLRLLAEFRQSLDSPDGGITLHYQPQIVLRTGEVDGVEALFRWTHPERGPIDPDTILQIVENTSTMRLLTARVIDEATAQLAAWRRDGCFPRVSINVSARDLYTEEIADRIAERLAYHEIPPELLQVEVTESAVSSDAERAAAVLKRIADLGVAVSLDDFGTGYSSLHHLRQLPIKEIKIDRSFIASMLTHTGDAAIVMSTIIMAQALGLRTVAEGISDAETQECLSDLGCDLGQGYHIAPPAPAAEIMSLPRS
jgi:diguanylate cyclase (GGDEF)-like protein